jgi:hypothetical protein
VGQGLGVGQIIDGDDVQIRVVLGQKGLEGGTADATEAIDGNVHKK